jgi:hypothetical protein
MKDGDFDAKAAKRVIDLRKKKAQALPLSAREKRELKKANAKVDANLRGLVRDIRRKDK